MSLQESPSAASQQRSPGALSEPSPSVLKFEPATIKPAELTFTPAPSDLNRKSRPGPTPPESAPKQPLTNPFPRLKPQAN